MDEFEQRLTRLMRGAQEPAPFEARHRERLRAGVRARRRARAARRAAGSVLAVTAIAVGAFLLPDAPFGREPAEPRPELPASRPSPGETSAPAYQEGPGPEASDPPLSTTEETTTEETTSERSATTDAAD
ncbi:cellulase [Streptomyces hainanensis]|uniref:Cellulase n=1 Tax=Streptomyces hainanensis TaxID=402648 RepID=A0A4R4TG20_9ACTN|nr:cellulase [Streptomyces hainanensis]TDC73893.1 cellulase [Streptomyces hainanensis]